MQIKSILRFLIIRFFQLPIIWNLYMQNKIEKYNELSFSEKENTIEFEKLNQLLKYHLIGYDNRKSKKPTKIRWVLRYFVEPYTWKFYKEIEQKQLINSKIEKAEQNEDFCFSDEDWKQLINEINK